MLAGTAELVRPPFNALREAQLQLQHGVLADGYGEHGRRRRVAAVHQWRRCTRTCGHLFGYANGQLRCRVAGTYGSRSVAM